MPLTKSPEMTPEKLAANQANGQRSQGPATPEGRERMRAANTRHGYYSKASGRDFRILGEDPEGFERLLDSLLAAWKPEDEYQAGLVRRMARLTWRLERLDRIQEAMTVHQLDRLERTVIRKTRQEAARHQKAISHLASMVEALEKQEFCTSEADIAAIRSIYQDKPTERAETVLLHLCQLAVPSAEERKELKLGGVTITVATGAERDRLRAELAALLREEIEALNAAYEEKRADAEELSPAFRDSMMAPSHPQAALVMRAEALCFSQLRGIEVMLTKLKGKSNTGNPDNGKKENGTTHDVDENK